MSLREFANRGCKIDATGSQESGYRLAEGGLNHGIGKPLEINVLGYKIAEGRWSKIEDWRKSGIRNGGEYLSRRGIYMSDDPTAPPLYDPTKPGRTIGPIRCRHYPWSRTRRACCYRQRQLQENNHPEENVPLSRRARSPCKFPRSPRERINLSPKARVSLFRAIT